jgi:hypothetical protein
MAKSGSKPNFADVVYCEGTSPGINTVPKIGGTKLYIKSIC